jgi:DNA-binding NarL/FixJ family response regulator
MQKNSVLNIGVVDDHPLFREGLVHLLETELDFRITLQADSASEALEKMETSAVDLLLLDLSLKESSGLDLLKDLGIRYPKLPVLVVSMHDEEYYAERVMAAGGKGYVMKQEDPERIITAIKEIRAGREFFPSRVRGRTRDPVTELSDREFSIFDLVSQGLGTKEISNRLNLSVKTVETHKEHIKTKLGQAGAAELLKFAIEWRRSSRQG